MENALSQHEGREEEMKKSWKCATCGGTHTHFPYKCPKKKVKGKMWTVLMPERMKDEIAKMPLDVRKEFEALVQGLTEGTIDPTKMGEPLDEEEIEMLKRKGYGFSRGKKEVLWCACGDSTKNKDGKCDTCKLCNALDGDGR